MQLKSVPITPIDLPELISQGVSLSVKRDDMQHGVVSGNKLYKLFYHLKQCQKLEGKTIITFGGAYSNHIHATAYAAKQLGLNSVAIIRGEQILPLNPTLKDCTDWGMLLEPVSRQEYKNKNQSSVINRIIETYQNAYVIPEGGCDLLGVQGASKILDGVDQTQFDYIVCACGTGTTLSGVIHSADDHIKVLGFAVLKGASWMQQEVHKWLGELESKQVEADEKRKRLAEWTVNTDYHFGGYAKQSVEIESFIKHMKCHHDLPLEHVYTAKTLYGVVDLAKKGFFKPGSRILFIHTGGIQGARG